MGRPEYNDDDVKNLLAELRRFVNYKYPKLKDVDCCRWAFYPLNPIHYLGRNMWDFLIDDASMNDCHDKLIEDAFNKGTLKNPKGDADAIFRSVKWLKEMLDEKYGGVENYLRKF